MTVAQAPSQTCDGCQKPMEKAKKVHGGHRYCAICYPRLFKRKVCPGCGNFARLPVDQVDAKCRKCELLAPCVRCSRVGRKVGLITPYGPACNSCAHHYRTPEPCDVCGKLSTRLSRVLKVDPSDRCCPKCARLEHASCPSCRRHRLLIQGENGLALCRACTEQGEISCGTCHLPMPAGRGKTCEACSWEKTFDQRLKLNVEEFELKYTRRLFMEFGGWLKGYMGAHRAALKIAGYMPFFGFLETDPTGIPSYFSLIEHFQAEGLRRMKTPMRWLKEVYGVDADPVMRENHSDKRRIGELLHSVPGGIAASTLGDYHAHLMMKVGEGSTTLRSVRISLRAAVGMLAEASPVFDALPTQASVRHYLISTPGQKAASQGFINYLNRTLDLKLEMSVSERVLVRTKRQKLESELKSMLRSGGSGESFERSWIKVALMLFHGVASVNKKKLNYVAMSAGTLEGFNVQHAGKEYWVPASSNGSRLDLQGV